MMTYKLQLRSKKLLADTLTPVNVYLKLRDVFAGSILLESSDYHGHENSLSMICCDPIASFEATGKNVEMRFPDGLTRKEQINAIGTAVQLLEQFRDSFKFEELPPKLPVAGLFGYTSYDSISYFEDITINKRENLIPEMIYRLYRIVILIDHFSNDLYLFETVAEEGGKEGELERIEQIIFSNRFSTFNFKVEGDEEANMSDDDFLDIVEKGIQHCKRGDVFQIVLSRRFSSAFSGDDFNVYRALRSINPSPYLFYFDYGNFKLFGSSPEAQLQVKNNVASIYPIAGTFRRTGNDQEDADLAAKLAADEKENAEHVMLVDLARNDMSRNAEKVSVEVFKEIQFYSHVIHLVSKVTGRLRKDSSVIRMAADTFPAGTLSGAPKHMAMTLIDKYENVNRNYYGGAIGYMGFNGDFNEAIMIRTFLSKGNRLYYQAGAGVVAKSKPVSELQEVNNKLMALRKALSMAERI